MFSFRKPNLQSRNPPKDAPSISMMGMPGVGKTTIWGAAIAAAQRQTSLVNNFYHDINAMPGHPILVANSYVRQGRFPPKTEAGKAYKAEVWLKWTNPRPLPPKEVKIKVVETSGERVRAIVDSYAVGFGVQQAVGSFSSEDSETIEEYILKSKDFIIVADLTQSPLNPRRSEEHILNASDPDMDCRDIVQSIQLYKREIVGDPHDPRFCILLAKYDAVRVDFETNGMDLQTEAGMQKFLGLGFPLTANKLSYTMNPKNIFLPVWVEGVKGDPNRIMMDPKTRLPFMSTSTLRKMLDWVKDIA